MDGHQSTNDTVIVLASGLAGWLGIGLTPHVTRHITVDVVTMRLPGRLRAMLEVLVSVIGIVILALMLWQMWEYAFNLREKGQYTQIKEIIIWPYAYVMCAAATLFLTGVFLYVRRGFWKFRHPEAYSGKDETDPIA